MYYSLMKINYDKIFENLNNANLPQTEFVKFMEDVHDPFIVLIACILSLRTNDKTTYPATMRMLEIGKTPKDFANCDLDVLQKAIFPVGFYKNKAKQIIELSKTIYEKMDSKVPNSIDELVKFNGVGRKTANLVMTKGFDKPAICVDVHVHRISNRMGLVNTKEPEETEFALRKTLPKKYWKDINTLFVTLGQNICKPQGPRCSICPVRDFCSKGCECCSASF